MASHRDRHGDPVDDLETVLKAKRAGVLDYLTKPLNRELLRQTLSRANDEIMSR